MSYNIEQYSKEYNKFVKNIGKDNTMKDKIKDILFRAVKTFCQTFVSVIGVEATLNTVDWKIVFSTAGLAFIVTIMTNIGNLD